MDREYKVFVNGKLVGDGLDGLERAMEMDEDDVVVKIIENGEVLAEEKIMIVRVREVEG